MVWLLDLPLMLRNKLTAIVNIAAVTNLSTIFGLSATIAFLLALSISWQHSARQLWGHSRVYQQRAG